MQNDDRQEAEAIAYFKAEARKAFAGICQQYGFVELPPQLTSDQNQFVMVFESLNVRIRAEGINWGMNTAIYLSKNTPEGKWFSIRHLGKGREPNMPTTGSQTDQLYGYAQYLVTYATDILLGDTRLIDQVEAALEQEKEEAESAKQAEIRRKLAAGYTSINNPYGEPILRKLRPDLLPYETARTQFEAATEIALAHFTDVLPDGNGNQGRGIVDAWFKEIGEAVGVNECVCEVSTDKVCLEVNSSVAGQLVWLLPEGTLVQAGQIIALVV